MQYKILASDYDNTLMPFGEAKPRPAVVKAVKKLQAAGGKFVLSTGRSYPGIRDKNQLGGIRYDYAITCNGACVVDRQGNVIAEHPLTSEEMYVLVDFCEDYNYPLQFNFRDAYYAYCEYEYLHTGYQMMNSPGLDCVDGEDQDRHLLDMPHAAFAAMPPQEVERFHEKYGYLGLHWMQTGAQNADGYCYYDIVRGGMDKGVGLADLCAQMGLTLADAVAVGDSANDVGMLKVAGLSACMANGTPDAKAAADRIIGDVREDGVAALTGEPLPVREDIAAKKQLLLRHGLALWDTLESCTITGASDASIRDVVPNDIAGLLRKAPIRAVFCNGATAYRIYTKYQQPLTGIPAVRLPSTSPANAACSPARLEELWGAALVDWIVK